VARPDALHSQRNRVRIAQAAARLIAEHGLSDWAAAKRKACRELGLGDRENLPGNDEIEQALREYHSLFRRDEQTASLRVQRQAALPWMERLSMWNPVLVGGVAAGWATPHSEVRVEIEAEDPKAVELSLINAGVEYGAVSGRSSARSHAELRIEADPPVRLIVVTPTQRRNRSRRDEEARLTFAELNALLLGEISSGASASD
jgi:hypothetical protein